MNIKNIFLDAVRTANARLIAGDLPSSHFVTDNTKDGLVAFNFLYGGHTYNVNISNEEINTAFAKSLEYIAAK